MNLRIPAIALLLLVLGAGCGGDTRGVPRVTRDLTVPGSTRALDLPLAPVRLETQADYDRFEKRTLNRIPLEHRAQVYEALWRGHLRRLGLAALWPGPLRRLGLDNAQELATKFMEAHRTGRAKGALRALQRLALLIFQTVRRTGKSTYFIQLMKLLRAAGGDDPDALFVLNFVRSDFLRAGSTDNTYRLTPKYRQVAEQLVHEWQAILERAPDYHGPLGWDAVRIRKEVEVLRRLLKATSAPVREATRVLDDVDEDKVFRARKILSALEQSKPRTLEALCRERKLRVKADKRVEIEALADLKLWVKADKGTEIEALADLRCAIILAKIEVALARLFRLAGTPTLGDACVWVKQLDARTLRPLHKYRGSASLVERLKTLMLNVCPRLAPPG